MTTCLIFSIPTDICNDICSDWLEVEDIVKFDSCVGQCDRSVWHAQLSSKSLHLQSKLLDVNNDKFTLSLGVWKWMSEHMVQMNTLFLHKKLFKKGKLLFDFKSEEIENISIKDVNIDLSDMINNCTNLHAFSVTGNFKSKNIYPDIAKQLDSLTLQVLRNSATNAASLILMCRNLQSLSFNFPLYDDRLYQQIVTLNPNLTSISCEGDEVVLESILAKFKAIQHVTLSTYTIPSEFLVNSVESWKKLTSLNIVFDFSGKMAIDQFSFRTTNGVRELIVLKYPLVPADFELYNVVRMLTNVRYRYATDDVIVELLYHSKQYLRSLSLEDTDLSINTLRDLFTCPKLTNFEFIGFYDQLVLEDLFSILQPSYTLLTLTLELYCPTLRTIEQLLYMFLALTDLTIVSKKRMMNVKSVMNYVQSVRENGRKINITIHNMKL